MINSVFVNTQGMYQRRRAYNMSYRNDFQTNIGQIVPCYIQDLIPNSSWRVRTHALVRFMPLLAPIMDNVDLYVHYWQSAYRILYGEEFTQMITGEDEDWPGIYWRPLHFHQTLSPAIYTAFQDETAEKRGARVRMIISDGGPFDMLGYDKTLFAYGQPGPVFNESNEKINARKWIMYIRLMRDWYSNENIEPYSGFFEATEMFDKLNFLDSYPDGDISVALVGIMVGLMKEYNVPFFCHAWPKDYFTSALPTLQYGLPTYLPLGESAPVTIPATTFSDGHSAAIQAAYGVEFQVEGGGPVPAGSASFRGSSQGDTSVLVDSDDNSVHKISGRLVTDEFNGTVDLTEATAITINELRVANALQIFKEREMRYGRKAPEYYKGFYGVSPGDFRLQLPKFLGGGKLQVNISDVEQMSQSTEGNPLGTLAGKGTAIGASFASASTFAPEETLVMGLCWLMPKVTYSQALSRHDTKLNDRFQYYNPSFAHIGEQEVFKHEVYAGALGTDADKTEFGYQPRYTEYRFHGNEMHGEFKNTLNYWTLGRSFMSAPALNAQFIYIHPEVNSRIFAAPYDSYGMIVNNVMISMYFSCAVLQPLSRYGTPGLLA